MPAGTVVVAPVAWITNSVASTVIGITLKDAGGLPVL